ncbi:3-ketoacyl-ACP reductase [Apibacter sp. B3889]|uniref:3-ketoacyl-ACP reductase n=1 Tax=unclassified Apibacter TaxID=2630820 RepID=UPI00132AEB90|nr:MULTISPECIES: 3-ketoacyl-ACP reductase [unclassified Apibacter]MXO35125.1 3-ketoacyl-ACP reductase [Apibacter sp. B3883]MXO42483.1 3-ketoacyl-ACP reductase [Apibacter sp. B3889]MXP04500.1 3-ketoacyl-ACP reductase [Apibacter sp. B3887]MXP08319.1 3-ketoacyl-ACP reductase [Apibacter sp. B3935]
MEKLTGKKAIVTGGNRGLGKAVALALAAEGVDVAITGRDEKTVKETVKELEGKGIQAAYSIFDVSNQKEVETEMEKLQNSFGSFDILINNAGISAFQSFLDMPVDQWKNIVQTNLFGPYFMSRAVLPAMIEKKGGDIINVSSTAGLKGGANTSAYSVSKAGLISLSESLMYEMRKHNIRVTTLTPSTIASDMSVKLLKITDGNPEKVLQPEDFAELVVDILKLNKRALLANASLWSTNP